VFKLSKESRFTFLGLLLVPLVWIGLNHHGYLDNLKTKALDWRMNWPRGEISHRESPHADVAVMVENNKTVPLVPKVIYVDFDQRTTALPQVGERPWPRDFFAEVAQILVDRGQARSIGFDFIFSPKTMSSLVPPGNVFQSDLALADLVRAHPNKIVFACAYTGAPAAHMLEREIRADSPYYYNGTFDRGASVYPESPSYPILGFRDGRFSGRIGSIDMATDQSTDAAPRWVPLFFPCKIEAQAYNVLGGRRKSIGLEAEQLHLKKVSQLQLRKNKASDQMAAKEEIIQGYDKFQKDSAPWLVDRREQVEIMLRHAFGLSASPDEIGEARRLAAESKQKVISASRRIAELEKSLDANASGESKQALADLKVEQSLAQKEFEADSKLYLSLALSKSERLDNELQIIKKEFSERTAKLTAAKKVLTDPVSPEIQTKIDEAEKALAQQGKDVVALEAALLAAIESEPEKSRKWKETSSRSLRLVTDTKNAEITMTNLRDSIKKNPQLAPFLKPRLDAKAKELEQFAKDLKVAQQSLLEIEKTVGDDAFHDEIGRRRDEIAKLQELQAISYPEKNQAEALKIAAQADLDGAEKALSSLAGSFLHDDGMETALVVDPSGASLRFIHATATDDNGTPLLMEGGPNEVPLENQSVVYALGIELLRSYWGIDDEYLKRHPEALEISSDRLIMRNRSGDIMLDAPLTNNQLLEINWFSPWKGDQSESGAALSTAKQSLADEDYEQYVSSGVRSIRAFLADALRANTADWAEWNEQEIIVKMKDLKIESELLKIASRFLEAANSEQTLSKQMVPDFTELSRLIDQLMLRSIPRSMASPYNPRCSIADVLDRLDSLNQLEELNEKLAVQQRQKEIYDFFVRSNTLIDNPETVELWTQRRDAIDVDIQKNVRAKEIYESILPSINEFFALFKDSIILIGPVDPLLQDLAPTPFDANVVPKVGLHGNLIKTLATGFYIKRFPLWIDHLATLLLCLLVAYLSVYSGAHSHLVQGLSVVLQLGFIVLAFYVFKQTHVVWPVAAPACAGLSTAFIGAAISLVLEQKAKGRIKGMFGSYVSQDLVDQMVDSGDEPSLGGEETQITAYFSDVQAFSSFSELLGPTGLVDLMNEYLTAMTNILQEERGTLDKYIGDAIVAMYGAPIPMADHAYQSVRTALLMQARQLELRDKWASEGDKWPDIVSQMQTRIGCNTGIATVGNMGALDRFNYTMMGDMVNLAARCESGAKAYGAYIMITEETKNASLETKDDIAFRYLDKIVVKGRTQPVAMYEPTGFMADLTQETQDCLDCFQQGIDKYLGQDWNGAFNMFEKAKGLEPNKPGVTPGVKDNPSMILMDRCQMMKDNPPDDDWDGVFVMTSK
jgi:class 3 adenylate cyclase/CHASE2 domain-containing sensor protein